MPKPCVTYCDLFIFQLKSRKTYFLTSPLHTNKLRILPSLPTIIKNGKKDEMSVAYSTIERDEKYTENFN
jgi:hypothetical protein